MEREEIKKTMKEAQRNLMIADHFIYKTYPLIKDPKLLLKIADDIHLSLCACVNCLLGYDELYKRIRPLPSDFKARLDIFKQSCVKLHGIDESIIRVIENLHTFLERYKKSSTAFTRQGSYMVFSDDFRVDRVDYSLLKNYLAQSKVFLTNVNKVFNYDIRFSI